MSRTARRRAATERRIGQLRAAAAAVAAVGLAVVLALSLPRAARVDPPAATVPGRPPIPPSVVPVGNGPQEPPGGPVTTAPGPTHRDEENAGGGRTAPPGGQDDPTPAPARPSRSAPPPSAGPGPGPDSGPPTTSPGEDLVLVDVCVEPLVCLEGGLL